MDGGPPPPPQIDSNLNKKAYPRQNNNSAFENQIQKINDRVATFVLNQIDLHLNKLDGNLNLEENLLDTGNKNSKKTVHQKLIHLTCKEMSVYRPAKKDELLSLSLLLIV